MRGHKLISLFLVLLPHLVLCFQPIRSINHCNLHKTNNLVLNAKKKPGSAGKYSGKFKKCIIYSFVFVVVSYYTSTVTAPAAPSKAEKQGREDRFDAVTRKFMFTIQGLTKTLSDGSRTILKNINLCFFPGAKIGVVGLNGSGKSIYSVSNSPFTHHALFDASTYLIHIFSSFLLLHT